MVRQQQFKHRLVAAELAATFGCCWRIGRGLTQHNLDEFLSVTVSASGGMIWKMLMLMTGDDA